MIKITADATTSHISITAGERRIVRSFDVTEQALRIRLTEHAGGGAMLTFRWPDSVDRMGVRVDRVSAEHPLADVVIREDDDGNLMVTADVNPNAEIRANTVRLANAAATAA